MAQCDSPSAVQSHRLRRAAASGAAFAALVSAGVLVVRVSTSPAGSTPSTRFTVPQPYSGLLGALDALGHTAPPTPPTSFVLPQPYSVILDALAEVAASNQTTTTR